MLEVRLTYSTDEGKQEVAIESGRTSFGRGDVDNRIDDDGLSRLHATVYREGDNVWVVDENSTNGTFVNGSQVQGSGTPLSDGDIVRIGNHTNMRVSITQKAVVAAPAARTAVPSVAAATASSTSATSASSLPILPIVIIAGAVFIIGLTSVVIGVTVFGGSNKPQIVQRETDPDDDPPVKEPKDSPTPKSSSSPGTSTTPIDNSTITPTNTGGTTANTPDIPSGKKYLDMSDAERRKYLEVKAMKVAQVIGNNSSEQIPAAAIDKIKGFADAYASRVKAKVRTGGCGFGDNLQATFERAAKDAPFINHAFNEKGMDPRIGLYLAMIESEHCVCLQSPTGPLGMFQFTKATAALHGLKVFAGASPSNPDERCEPEPAARAAASYMKALAGRYGTGPSSVPLAIGSNNSGEGGLSQNLEKALSSGQGLERDFWTLISKGDLLSKQFQAENFKYVPKFFAAAIIGENPQDFGLNLQPVSTYSK
jgi:pSer/pThr/pTyr-binding forkhead associated (FHA) protein